MKLTSISLGAALTALGAASPVKAPQAHVLNGTYTGVHNTQYNQDFFLGIPYAQPPLGDLRLRVPHALNTSWDGARNATSYSHMCYGYGSDTWVLDNYVSEDCLTINVVRPSGIPPSTPLPVAVWIHGGGFTMGSGSDPRYNLSDIVAQSVAAGTPMVAASINYRLQNWGFLHSAALAAEGSTNLGFRDQRLALHWVRENIAAFGGDADAVTIWGESAGAFSVGWHLVAYGGRDDGLFRSAILESGSPFPLGIVPQTAETWAPYWDALLNKTGCDTDDPLSCLRAIPAPQLSDVFNGTFPVDPTYGQVVDGDVFTELGYESLRKGHFVRVPILAGTNFDEGSIYGPLGINTTAQFGEFLVERGVDESLVPEIERLYPDDPAVGLPATFSGRPTGEWAAYGAQWKRAVAWNGDSTFHAARRLTTAEYARRGVPVYSYHWDVLVAGIPPPSGATHFQEVVFVFDNVEGRGYETPVSTNPLAGRPKRLVKLADVMSKQWVSFIAHGDPNHHDEKLHWPLYTADAPRNLVFDVNATDSGYVEDDTFRKEGISFILDRIFK